MIKAIIFDLDGTLCDTLDDLLTAMNEMLRSYNWEERTREDLLRFINRGARNFVSDSMPDYSHSSPDDEIVTEAIAKYNECYEKCYCDKTAPYEGIAEALYELKKHYKLGVLSNKQEFFVCKMIEKLLPGIFESVHGNVSGIPTKPDKKSLDRLFDELEANPEECVFVGDSDIDMKTGINGGAVSLGVTWGYRDKECLTNAGASFLCGNPVELPAVISQIDNLSK